MDNSNYSLIDALFSKTRKAVITRLFARPEQSFHLRELARIADVSPTMLAKEIDAFAACGIVISSKDGNRRLIRANEQCPIFDELRGIARKTSGLADVIAHALLPLQGIDVAFIFGSVARGEEGTNSDVDVCVVGSVSNAAVFDALVKTEAELGRPVNPIVYTVKELNQKVLDENHFVTKMLDSKMLVLMGDIHGLKRAVGKLQGVAEKILS